MDTKKLRQKILDLAIHGKLVPQDPNDEPASVLLERIRAEKERLIAEGKIKRSKKSVTSDTSHYENVPQGWCISTIGEVFNLQAGKNISANDIHECSQNFPYACYGGNGIRGYVSDYNRDGKFPIIGRQGALCGNVNFAEGKFYATEHAVVVTCFAGVNIEWTRYVLEAMNLNQYATATAQPGLSVATVNEVEFMLPPLNEQCRIAEFIANCFETIESLTTQTNDLRLNLDKAKSKILNLAIHGKLVPQDASDEPASELLKRINPKAVASCDNPQYGKVPSSWVISTVGEVFTINPKTRVEDDTEAAFVPMTCVADGYSNTFEYECRKWGDIKKGFVHFQENDVAVAKISPCLENRKSVVFHDLPNGIGAGTTELNVFRCEEILPEYALFYFKSQMFIGSCAGTYNGVVGQQRVAKSFIQELPIGIPPYNEQLRIVSKINELFSQLDMIEKSLQA